MNTRLAIDSMEMIPIGKAFAARFAIKNSAEWLRVRGYRHSGEHGPAIAWYEYLINAEYAAVGRLLPRHVGPIIPLIEDLFSTKIVTVEYSIKAVPMVAEHASTLQVDAGSPSLTVVARCETSEKKIAMITTSLNRGSDVGYSITLRDKTTQTTD